NRVEEIRLFYRLREISCEAEFAATHQITPPPGRRQHDDLCFGESTVSTNLRRQLEAIDIRHVRINDCQRKRTSLLRGFGHRFKAGAGVTGGNRRHPPVLQHFSQDLAIGCRVVDSEHRQTLQIEILEGSRRNSGASYTKLRRKMKCTSLPDFAFEPDPAIHE